VKKDVVTAPPRSTKRRTAVLVGGLTAVAAVAIPVMTTPVSAQEPSVYDCTLSTAAGPLPGGGQATATATATLPAAATVDDPVGAGNVSMFWSPVTPITFASLGVAPAAVGGLTGAGTLGPNGSVTLGKGDVTLSPGGDALVGFKFTGGSGSVTAQGTPGGSMAVTLQQFSTTVAIEDVPLITIACTTVSNPALLGVVALRPARAPRGGGNAVAPTPVDGNPGHSG
jgi:hypothetical protein